MRLFPPAHTEHDHQNVSNIDNQSIGIIAGLGVVTAGLALTSAQRGSIRAIPSGIKNVALLTKGVACATAVAVPYTLHNRYVEQRIDAHISRSENSAISRTVFADRLSHFDSDNAIILGGLVSTRTCC